MRNMLLAAAFDGTAYCGFQRQKNGLSVQQVLEEAIEKAVGQKIILHGCSRTDAGVHAREFYLNFKTESLIPADRFPYALNSLLPDDVSVLSAREVREDFHARFCCAGKEYTYEMYLSPVRDPFLHRRALRCPSDLDLPSMQKAAAFFEGAHDFEAFAAANRTTKTTVRSIFSCRVEASGKNVTLRVHGDGFLYNQVRIMTGTLLYVAKGKLAASDIPEILLSKKRKCAGPTVPPYGLYLNRVFYNEKEF